MASFRRRVTLMPGVRLNFSSRGVSATVGVRGASVNFSSRGTTVNLGIPGTGISTRSRIKNVASHTGSEFGSVEERAPAERRTLETGEVGTLPDVAEVTTEGLEGVQDLIRKAIVERKSAALARDAIQSQLDRDEGRVRRLGHWFWRLFSRLSKSHLDTLIETHKADLEKVEQRLTGAFVDADANTAPEAVKSFEAVVSAFKDCCTSARIWDVTHSTFGQAAASMRRSVVTFRIADDGLLPLQTSGSVLQLENANGSDLYLFANLALMVNDEEVGLIDLRTVDIDVDDFEIIEPSAPTDAERVTAEGKDGGIRCCRLLLSSAKGLREMYLFSNREWGRRFAEALIAHRGVLNESGKSRKGHGTEKSGTERDYLPEQRARCTIKGLKIGCAEEPVMNLRFTGDGSRWYRKPVDENDLASLVAEAEYFAKNVVMGWEHVWEDGQPARFEPEKVLEMLEGLRKASASHFVSVLRFSRDPKNFER